MYIYICIYAYQALIHGGRSMRNVMENTSLPSTSIALTYSVHEVSASMASTGDRATCMPSTTATHVMCLYLSNTI